MVTGASSGTIPGQSLRDVAPLAHENAPGGQEKGSGRRNLISKAASEEAAGLINSVCDVRLRWRPKQRGSERAWGVSGRGGVSVGPSTILGILQNLFRVINRGCGLRSEVMSGGGAISRSQVWKKRRLATSTVNRGIQRGWLIQAAKQRATDVLQAQRWVSGESAALIWVGVGGECPAW